MPVTYNPVLVFASAIIATFAAYITLEVSSRLSAAEGTNRTFWLVSGAVCLGSGIWGMHFIAMLAFSIPISITYNFLIVLISLLVPILVSFLALSIVGRPQPALSTLLIGSVIIGSGIATMHYSGMAAMQMSANLDYNPLLFMLSVLIAIAVSFVALVLSIVFRKSQEGRRLLKVLSAVLMGAAVMSMHYTGMAAANFAPNPGKIIPPTGLDNMSLAVIVCLYTLFVMGLVLSVIYIEPKRGI